MRKRSFYLSALTFVFSFLFLQQTYSQENLQPGYVILKSGDTLRGIIDYRNWENNPKSISFRESKLILPIEYSPNAIHGFSVNNEVYISAVIPSEISPKQIDNLDFRTQIRTRIDTAFLQILCESTKNLYFYSDKDGNQNFYIGDTPDYELLIYKKYLKQGDREKIVAENKNFIGQLKIYFQDCSSIIPEINTTKYNKKSMNELFRKYAECKHSTFNCQHIEEKPRYDFGILAGVSKTRLDLSGGFWTGTYLEENNFPVSWNISAGLYLNVVFPWKERNWSIYNELILSSYEVNQHFEKYTNAEKYTLCDVTLGYSYIKLNNMIRYNLEDNSDFSMFFNVGISSGLAIHETNSVIVQSKDYGPVATTEQPAVYDTQKYEQGFLAGLGFEVKKISLELRLEKGSGMTRDSKVSATSRGYLLFGFRFGK
jgi:hypothetical protein